jgi:hypothetical protein
MHMNSLKAQFDEYFQVSDQNQVNLLEINKNDLPKNTHELEACIPTLFKLANEINELDHNALRPLRNLGDLANELAAFLQAQSRKIDLIMSHILATEQKDENNTYCDSYGGGGLTFSCEEQYKIGTNFQTKFFLHHEASAIFCFTQVVSVERLSANKFKHGLAFVQIREADQELIVRASLHAQTRQLKKRKSSEEH